MNKYIFSFKNFTAHHGAESKCHWVLDIIMLCGSALAEADDGCLWVELWICSDQTGAEEEEEGEHRD